MKNLKDRVVVITGAASGIGRATALAFADKGADIVISDINPSGLSAVEEEVRAKGRRVLAVISDVSKENDIRALFEQSIAQMGRVDIVVSNAGTGIISRTEELSAEEWHAVLSVNLWGTIHCIRHFVPYMVKQKSGHLVIVSSGMGLTALPFMAPYVTSKFALVGLSECLRAEMAAHGIGVTTICPGLVKTPIFQTSPTKGFSRDVLNVLTWTGTTSPEKIAHIIVKGVRRNRKLVVVTRLAKISWLIKRILPGLFELFLRRLAKAARKYEVPKS